MAAFWLGSSLGNRRQKPALFPFPRVSGPTKKYLLVYYVLGFLTERGGYVFHKMGAFGLFFSWAQALTLPSTLSICLSPSFPLVQAAPPFCLFSGLYLCFEAFTPPGGSCHESGLSPVQGIFHSFTSQRGSTGSHVYVPNPQPSSR